MWMAHQGRMRGVRLAVIQQRFQLSGGSFQEKRSNATGHTFFIRKRWFGLQPDQMPPPAGESPTHDRSIYACTPMDPVRLTRRLVDIESISGNEGAVGAALYDELYRLDYTVHKIPVAHERFNVQATLADKPPEIIFSTHIDTVPPFIPSSEDSENIYGRGACDAKGIVAAQIAACERLRREGAAVGMLFLVGEERDSLGARVANQPPLPRRFLINGEPADKKIAMASKGAL